MPAVAFSQEEAEDDDVPVGAEHAQTPDIAADAEEYPEGEPPPVLEVNGRLYTRWARTVEDDDPVAGKLSLSRARFQLTWHPLERVEAQLGADFANLQMLDAFAAVETTPWLTLRAGQRKVPFSGARLGSLGDLRPIRRGEYVGFVSTGDPADPVADSMGYSGRKVGVDALLRSRRLLRLRLDIGLSQGSRGATDPAVRASVRVLPGLRVAAAAAALRSPTESVDGFWAVAYELDATYDRKRWHAELEAATGKNWSEPAAGYSEGLGPASDRPWFLGGYALAAYDFSLGEARHPSIEPHVRVEFIDETDRYACDETLGATVGATLHAFDVVRLQLDLERLERPASGGGQSCADIPDAPDPDETKVMLQLALDV